MSFSAFRGTPSIVDFDNFFIFRSEVFEVINGRRSHGEGGDGKEIFRSMTFIDFFEIVGFTFFFAEHGLTIFRIDDLMESFCS